ncbi:pilus assembly protein [Salmonella enterica]|nr:pilus assembly protein [Salmonella enterica]
MKSKLLCVTAMLFMLSPLSQADLGQGVIVHDNQSLLKTIQQWKNEAQQWTKELDAYKAELLSKTGLRDVQKLVQDADAMRKELTSIYNEGNAFIGDYIKDPKGALSGKALNLIKEYRIDETCQSQGYVGDAQRGCEAKIMADLATYEYSKDLNKKVNNEFKDMNQLMEQVKNADNIKASQDAANAIEVKKLKLDAIRFQYQMLKDRNESQSKYMEEMKSAQFKKQQAEAPYPTFGDKPFEELK